MFVKKTVTLTSAAIAAVLLFTGCSNDGLTHEDLYGLGQMETNSIGEYRTVVFDKEGYLKERIEYMYPPKLINLGFTEEDVLDAELWLAKYVIEEAIDSPALDNSKDWELWKKETLPKYTNGATYSDIIGESIQATEDIDPALKIEGGDVILKELPLKFKYDGSERISSVSLAFEKVNGGVVEGMDNFLVFNGIVRPTYVTDKGKETVNYKFEYLVGRDADGWKLLGGSALILY